MRIAKPTKTVITKQPNGSYTIRDGQSYDELLKEVNKGMNEYKQFRNLYDDIPDIVANNNPKPKSKPKPSSSNRSPLWQFELQEAILDRGVRF